MQIYGPFRLSATQPTTPSTGGGANRVASPGVPSASSPVDQLDLSATARTSGAAAAGSTNRIEGNPAIAGGGEIRIDRVADLRRQIASGAYETPEKIDAALDRFLDEFA